MRWGSVRVVQVDQLSSSAVTGLAVPYLMNMVIDEYGDSQSQSFTWLDQSVLLGWDPWMVIVPSIIVDDGCCLGCHLGFVM